MVKKYIVLIIVGVVFMANSSYGISQDEKNFLHACRYGQMYVIEELIDKVNINVQDEEGYTPLMNAITEGEIEIVKILLEHNADVIKIKDNSGRNAFFLAAVLDELEMLKLFEKYNPDFNVSDNYGSNVFFFTRKVETVNYFLQHGADINKRNKSGRTPLIQHSLAYENQDHVKFLLEKGADINAQDNKGNTLLMYAIALRNEPLINEILKLNPDVNIKNKEGKTANDMAKEYGYKIVK